MSPPAQKPNQKKKPAPPPQPTAEPVDIIKLIQSYNKYKYLTTCFVDLSHLKQENFHPNLFQGEHYKKKTFNFILVFLRNNIWKIFDSFEIINIQIIN